MPYVGLWLRITHRFSTRRAEWMASLIAAGFGHQIIFTPGIMDHPQWVVFNSVFPPIVWGAILFADGVVSLVALTINGASPNVTPKIRMAAAFLRLFIWAAMGLMFIFGGVPDLWATLLLVLFIFEWSNLSEASKDVGEAHASRNTGHIHPAR